MSTDLVLLFLVSTTLMLLCCLNRWLYVCLIALIEVVWVLLVGIYARISLEFVELSLYFWSLSWLFVATVESIAGIFTFVAYSQLSGQIYA